MVRRFMPEDMPIIKEWADGWEIPCPSWGDLPRVGFISPKVAAFLLKTDSSVAQMDFAIADPTSTEEERVAGFTEVIAKLEEIARYWGKSHLTAFSAFPTVEQALEASHLKTNCKVYFHFVKEL